MNLPSVHRRQRLGQYSSTLSLIFLVFAINILLLSHLPQATAIPTKEPPSRDNNNDNDNENDNKSSTNNNDENTSPDTENDTVIVKVNKESEWAIDMTIFGGGARNFPAELVVNEAEIATVTAGVYCIFYIADDVKPNSEHGRLVDIDDDGDYHDRDNHHDETAHSGGERRKIHKGLFSRWFSKANPLRDQNFRAKRLACVRVP